MGLLCATLQFTTLSKFSHMHHSIADYLTHLADKGRSPLTVKAARSDLLGFATWWEAQRRRPFAPVLLRENDVYTWRLTRQKDDAAAPRPSIERW